MAAPPFPRGATLIGLSLVAVALAFAGWRSMDTPPVSATIGTDNAAIGTAVWASDCASCHGEGEARGSFIPALHGLAVDLWLSEGGQDYLIDLLLTGDVRRLSDGTVSFAPGHPAVAELGDTEIAEVINHMLRSWGNAERLPAGISLLTARDVAARRDP